MERLYINLMPLFVEQRAKHNGGVLAQGLVDAVFLQTHSEIIRMVRMSFTGVLSESAAVSVTAKPPHTRCKHKQYKQGLTEGDSNRCPV